MHFWAIFPYLLTILQFNHPFYIGRVGKQRQDQCYN